MQRKVTVIRALASELRPHQWAKNALVLVPPLLVPGVPDPKQIAQGLIGAVAFSFGASAGYVLNDLLDLQADRAHATKKLRPFASGDLAPAFGPPLCVALVLAAFGLAHWLLPAKFSLMLAIYLVGTVAYSLVLKRLLLIDVLVLAALYAHRILAGGVAANVHVSAWLIGFSVFLFTSLAFAKRYVELKLLCTDDRISNRGYFRVDLEIVTSMGTASGLVAALVFMLYVDSAAVRAGYRQPDILWLALPVLIYWLGRIWLLAGRGQMQDDPVRFALKDISSLTSGAIIVAITLIARVPPAWLVSLFH